MPDTCKTPLETVILGSGPAGLTAAIYAARSRCCPLVIHGAQPGGQLTGTTVIENFPGFPEGIDGPTLMERMHQQAERFGTRFLEGEVTRVDFKKTPFQIWAGDDCYQAKSVIISTGASPRMLGLENEWDLYGRGVSVCATCDGFFYKEREVVVVGGGDTAMEEATFLTRFARRVTIVHRRDELRASPPLQKRARENKKVAWRWNTVVTAIHADQSGVTGLRLKDVNTGAEEDIACDGLFVAIGHNPNTELFTGQLHMDQDGYILTKNGCETSIPGIFASGDVQDPLYRQAITAAGSGCRAAMMAERYLDDLAAYED